MELTPTSPDSLASFHEREAECEVVSFVILAGGGRARCSEMHGSGEITIIVNLMAIHSGFLS